MNHFTAWIITLTAFSSGLYGIYKYIGCKYNYYKIDTKPIHYWLNKKQGVKKRYKSFKKRNKKHLVVNKINRIGSFSKYNNLNNHKI
jgi:hypothetical protein